MQQLSPIDAAFVLMEQPRTPFHVTMVNIYDPSTCPGDPPTFDDIVEAVQATLPAAPTFQRRIVRVPLDLDYPYWIEDEHFDLEYHMRHLALPKPGDWKQFRAQVARLMARPLDLTRPPWELTVIDGLDGIDGLPPGCFANVLKVHHSAIDGVAGVELFSALHQLSPHEKPAKLVDRWQPEAVPAPSSCSRTPGGTPSRAQWQSRGCCSRTPRRSRARRSTSCEATTRTMTSRSRRRDSTRRDRRTGSGTTCAVRSPI